MGAEFIFCSLCFGLDFQTKRQNQGPNLCYPLNPNNLSFGLLTLFSVSPFWPLERLSLSSSTFEKENKLNATERKQTVRFWLEEINAFAFKEIGCVELSVICIFVGNHAF